MKKQDMAQNELNQQTAIQRLTLGMALAFNGKTPSIGELLEYLADRDLLRLPDFEE